MTIIKHAAGGWFPSVLELPLAIQASDCCKPVSVPEAFD